MCEQISFFNHKLCMYAGFDCILNEGSHYTISEVKSISVVIDGLSVNHSVIAKWKDHLTYVTPFLANLPLKFIVVI